MQFMQNNIHKKDEFLDLPSNGNKNESSIFCEVGCSKDVAQILKRLANHVTRYVVSADLA